MIARGYGVSVEFDGATVRLIGGKAQAAIWRTGSVEIPTADITAIDYKPATRLVNGHMTFAVTRPANEYATPREDGAPTTVPQNGLIVHWRRKDEAAFDALYQKISMLTHTQ